MFKYAVLIAALAATASAAVSQPNRKEPTAEASHIVVHKQPVPEKFVYMSEVNVPSPPLPPPPSRGGGGLSGILEIISLPTKFLDIGISKFINKLKSLNLKKILKGTLVAAIVTVLGAVAAVAVAGLVSLVSGICAVAPYIRFFFGAGQGGGELSESKLDSIGNFVLSAFNKYEMAHKA